MAPELSPRRFIWSAGRLIGFLAFLYLFLVSVKLLGTGFKMFGGGFAEQLISTTSNPFVGLFIGILATSIIQSSSTTTSTVVGFVAAGVLSIENAVPIIMGANIGTAVTCAIVSMGHITRREEFRRAIAAATVHDFFNIITVVVLFPLELATGFLRRSAQALTSSLVGTDGLTFASPVKKIVGPAIHLVVSLVEKIAPDHAALAVAILGIALLFLSLYFIVRYAKGLALKRAEVVLDRFMGKSGIAGMALGCAVTATIQSSSVTTSLLVPLAGAGIVHLEQVFAIALGANVGTTITALLASLAGDVRGLTIALVHLLFNICGILLIYPLRPIRRVPIILATRLGNAAARAKRNAVFFIIGVFFVLPVLMIFLSKVL
ncbi:Na/Pi symporter [Candidatus Zixiibacteriota bacterium]